MAKDKKELSDEEIEKLIEKLKKEMSEEDFKEFMDELENMEDDDFDISDFAGEDEKDKEKKDVKESFVNEGVGKFITGNIKRNIRKGVAAAWSNGIKNNPIGQIATVVKMKRTRNNMALLQKQADEAKDPKEKQRLLDTKEAIKLSSFDSNGSYIIDPIQRNARIKNLQKDGKINKDLDLSKEALNKLNKEGKEFGKTDEGKKYKKEQKKELRKARLSQWSGVSDWKDAKADFKEKVVKDKDGSEIHSRPKKNGEGNTYVRMKGGKEIGYASKEDFQKAQQRKAKKQNESNESLLSLSDYMSIYE